MHGKIPYIQNHREILDSKVHLNRFDDLQICTVPNDHSGTVTKFPMKMGSL